MPLQHLDAALQWIQAQEYKNFFLLCTGTPSDTYPPPHSVRLLFGGSHADVPHTILDDLAKVDSGGFYFTMLSYDAKNEIEPLDSKHLEPVPFPNLVLLQPNDFLELGMVPQGCRHWGRGEKLYRAIQKAGDDKGQVHGAYPDTTDVQVIDFVADVDDDYYLGQIGRIQQEIVEGNVYEMNYCRNYTARAHIDPYALFSRMQAQAAAPFSGLVKLDGKYVVCGSMERFMAKTGQRLVSQPIKGTRANKGQLAQERHELLQSEKERAENLMIVDLVRNDLNRCCIPGTVAVDELFGIYTFAAVHQMISTVSGEIRPGLGLYEVVRSMFPMGSMTGAPKVSSMQLIEQYERFKRGAYSGSIGYVNERGDFDMNVVIRSVLYDSHTGNVSVPVGSALTIDSIPSGELEECRAKIEKIKELVARSVVRVG